MVAHPFDDGTAAVIERSVERTAAALGRDRGAYERRSGRLVRRWPLIETSVLGPLELAAASVGAAAFGMRALNREGAPERVPGTAGARRFCRGSRHMDAAARSPPTAGVGLVLG